MIPTGDSNVFFVSMLMTYDHFHLIIKVSVSKPKHTACDTDSDIDNDIPFLAASMILGLTDF